MSAKIGWERFCRILQIAQDEYPPNGNETDGSAEYHDHMDLGHNFAPCEEPCAYKDPPFGDSVYLGHIWVAMQTELLT